MSVVLISNSLVSKLEIKNKEYDIRDSRIPGFMLRVYPSGYMAYAVQYARGKRVTLGKVGVLSVAQAREKAVEVLADFARGVTPKQAEAARKGVPTLKAFIKNDYAPWVVTHNASGQEAINTIVRHFSHLLDTSLDQISSAAIEKWRVKKLQANSMKPNTINRTVTPLRSAISKAVEWGMIKDNGLSGLKALKYDDTRIRFLSETEKSRLMSALKAREKSIKEQRENANQWRSARGYDLYPEYDNDDFVDHLMPLIVVALNTGVRRGELLALKREHIDLDQATLYVEKSKNYLARYIPLNKTAVTVLSTWLRQTQNLNSHYLFPSPMNPAKPIGSVKKAWAKLINDDAKIENFRWHDLRHDFASNLVMKEVSLYAVQKLLGHKKIEQTMKYAHLAPEFVAESVARLD